ncbi:hypothetical protein Clacol_002091 [Clathrus columnatus]|uniref:Uncharacterized protein n=1 Tax=Clathrus columnatus TaxID=1419009 RepID=A0AAV5A7K6_9AGAM|nr:hypothetical protein Clacol_002091 [Clathrus columnatus]
MLECCGTQYVNAALRQALLWKPGGDLLSSSKLTAIYWDGLLEYIEYLPPLLTSTLQILQVQLDIIENPRTLCIIYKTISLHSPSLRSFELSFPPANEVNQAISQSLGELFTLLTKLALIRLPSHCMTGELFTVLSDLSRLQDLSLPPYPRVLYMDENILERLRKLKTNDDQEARKDIPFRSLDKLDISGSDFMMAEILRRDIQLLKLVDLTYRGSSRNRTIAFMESVPRVCPNLEKISIFANNSLPFEPFRSLLKCPALVKIVSDGTIDMDLEDIVIVASDRSTWQVIVLPSVKPLGYQALIPFAQNCPDLYQLGLKLTSTLGFPDINSFPMDVKFSSLTSLDVGLSVLTSDFALASFLSRICSKPIEINSDGSQENCRLWKNAEELVNFVIKIQHHNQTLKDTVTLLRGN